MFPHQQYSPEHTVSNTAAVRVYTVHRHGVVYVECRRCPAWQPNRGFRRAAGRAEALRCTRRRAPAATSVVRHSALMPMSGRAQPVAGCRRGWPPAVTARPL